MRSNREKSKIDIKLLEEKKNWKEHQKLFRILVAPIIFKLTVDTFTVSIKLVSLKYAKKGCYKISI